MINLEPFKGQRKNLRVTLPTNPSTWVPPTTLPNLSGAKALAVDTETWDPELLQCGPGWARGVGHLVGVSIATEDEAWYFPLRHEVEAHHNMNILQVTAWLQEILGTDIPKIFANASYDIGWLKQEGINIKGKCYDVQGAEALIDGNRFSYALELLGQQYMAEGKTSNDLYQWCARAYGGKVDGKQRANIYRAPASLVGAYAESDARLPYGIFEQQLNIIEGERLDKVLDLETRLTPMLVDMRFRGVKVDLEALEIAKHGLQQQIYATQQKLNKLAGKPINVNSSSELAKLCTKHDIPYEVTAKGNPSFQATWLERQPYELLHWVREIRKNTKTVTTFLNGIGEKQIDGRLYTTFNALRSGDFGTITGRFSSSNPNLQNIPSRDPVLGPMMRSIFIPDDYFPEWVKMDYSSIEFRCFVHRNQDPGFLQKYKEDPQTDFHQVVIDIIGGSLPRVAYKTFNFSRMYGGGVKTITTQMLKAFDEEERKQHIVAMGITPLTNTAEQLARLLMKQYDEQFPMVSDQLNKEMELADEIGEVRTQLGRRITFDRFQGLSKTGQKSRSARAGSYKALNYYNQGTAADIMKKGMVEAYESGLFEDDKLGLPHLTVHDELDISYHPDLLDYVKETKFVMENAIQLSVPIVVDVEIGKNWGSVKEVDLGYEKI